MSRAFVDPPAREPIPWSYCSACATSYDSRFEHECEDPLGAARGIVLCALGGLVIYAVLATAALVEWWPL